MTPFICLYLFCLETVSVVSYSYSPFLHPVRSNASFSKGVVGLTKVPELLRRSVKGLFMPLAVALQFAGAVADLSCRKRLQTDLSPMLWHFGRRNALDEHSEQRIDDSISAAL